MVKRPSQYSKSYLTNCPHCGRALQDYVYPDGIRIQKRCRICRCRWALNGKHVYTGRYCSLQKVMPLGV